MESGNITEPVKESGSQIEKNVINQAKSPEMLEIMSRLKENPEMLEIMLKVKENPEMLEMFLKVKENPEILEMMVKIKEEPISDDENEEADAIRHTNYLDDSAEELVETDSENCMKLSNNIKEEVIRLNEEQGIETDHSIQKIKLETSDCNVEEKHTNTTAESIEDNLKLEEHVVAWAEDHYESSCSSEQPDWRDKLSSFPEFKHFLEESEIKYDVQNSLKRKIGETHEDSCSDEEISFDLTSDEDDVYDVVLDEASKPKLKKKECVKILGVPKIIIERSVAAASKEVSIPPGWKREEVKRKKVAAASKEVFIPPGWRRVEVVRKNGCTAGVRDIYYHSPNGKKLRSLKEVKKYCLEDGLHDDLSIFNKLSFSRSAVIASKSPEICNNSKTKKPSKTEDTKNKEGSNGKIAENFAVIECGRGRQIPIIKYKEKTVWSNEMKAYAVKRYLETRNYKKTIADFTTKFNPLRPPYKVLIENWVTKYQRIGTIQDLRNSTFNLETYLARKKKIQNNTGKVKDKNDRMLANSSLRNIRIDKQHPYYSRKKIRIMHQPPLVANVTPKGDKLLSIMKNVFNDKDNCGDNDDNTDDSLHQDSNNGEATDKYLKMWKVIYPLVDVQEQKDMHQETQGDIRQTMDNLRKLNEERNNKRLEAIVIKNTIKKTKSLKEYIQDREKIENSDSSTLQEVDLLMNSSASSSVLKAELNIEKDRNEDIKHMWRGVLDSVKIEKFIQTSSVIFTRLTKEEIRRIYEEFKGNGQAIMKMKHLNKERKKDDILNKMLEESKQDIERNNIDYIDNSDETNDGPLQNGKINKYIKMWKVLYPAVNVKDQRKVYLENKGDVKKTMVELKKLNERTETDRIKDPYTVWSLADEETFSAGVCCPFCGRFFNYKASFLKHYNTHREEKPFACKYCQYRSKTENNVNIHIQRTHREDPLYVYQCKNEERPYGCPYCAHRSKSKDDRDKHILKTHRKRSYFYKDMEERPFACSYCLYRSKQKGNLKTHVYKNHPDKHWPAPIMEEILKKAKESLIN